MNIKTRTLKIKNHLARNKFAYAAVTVAFLAWSAQQANKMAFETFLAEKGINPLEFNNPELFAKLNA